MQAEQRQPVCMLVQGIMVCLVWAALGVGLTFADTWYVRVLGADSQDCLSPDQACATIHAAIEKAVSDGNGAGDTIFVGAGTYVTPTTKPRKEGIRILTAQGGTAAAPFQLIADTDGSRTGDAGMVQVVGGKNGFVISASFVTIDGFTILNPTGVSGVLVSGSNTGIILQNLEVSGAPQHGITLQKLPATAPHRKNIIIRNIVIHDNGSSAKNHYGFQMRSTDDSLVQGVTVFNHVNGLAGVNIELSSGNTLADIVVHNNGGIGIFVQNAHNNTFKNILSYNNGKAGIHFAVSSGNSVRNATLYGNSGDGYKTSPMPSGSNQLIDSIVAFNGEDGIDDQCFCTNHTFNTISMNTRDFFPLSITATPTEIIADPLFIDAAADNFRLQQVAAGESADSPGVNAGSDTAANVVLDTKTTRSDNVPDMDKVDLGYHY